VGDRWVTLSSNRPLRELGGADSGRFGSDKTHVWQDLSLNQQLNVICDGLAKTAALKCIYSYPLNSIPSSSQLLPYKDLAIFVNAVKQTLDSASAIHFACGKHNAKQFLMSEKGWSTTQFKEVNWENLHASLQTKLNGF
jgi:hypothetical protein